MLGRYTGDVRWKLEGSYDLCARWAGVGLNLLGEIRHLATLNGLGVIARQIVLGDGTVIGAKWDGSINQVYIRAANVETSETTFSITLETGMVDVRKQTANLLLYYGAREMEAWNGGCPKWLDELLLVVRQVQQDNVTPPAAWDSLNCGRVRTPVSGALPSIGFQGVQTGVQLINERADLRYPSPGYATGRLKLYVQALLGGIKDLDYVRADHEGAEDEWTKKVCTMVRVLLPLNELADGPTWTGYSLAMARGLFVTDDLEYWVIFIDDADIRAAKVRLSVEGMLLRRAWRAHLKQEPGAHWRESSQVEAYLLSGAVQLNEPILVAEGLLAGIEGKPIHEGWKFNSTGHEARIVTDETIYGTPYELEPDLSVILKHRFRQYHLTMTYTPKAEDEKAEDWKPFLAHLEKVEEVDATPEAALWVADRYTDQYRMIWYDWHEWRIGRGRGYIDHLEFDAPVYGFYQMNDAGAEEWVTLRVEYHQGQDTRDAVAQAIQREMTDDVDVCGEGKVAQKTVRKTTQPAPEVFYLKTTSNLLDLGVTWTAPAVDRVFDAPVEYSLSLTDAQVYAQGITAGGIAINHGCGHSWAPPSCEGIGIHGLETLTGGWWEASYYQSPFSYLLPTMTDRRVAVLPYGEGQAVYLLRKQDTLVQGRWTHFKRLTTRNYHFQSDLIACPGGCGGDLNVGLWYGWVGAHGMIPSQDYEETRVDTMESTLDWICIGSKTVGHGLSMTVHSKTDQTVTTLRNYQYPETVVPGDPYTVDQQWGKNATFFSTELEYPWLGYPVNALESWSGDLRFLSQLADVSEDSSAVFHPVMANTDETFPALEDSTEIVWTGWA